MKKTLYEKYNLVKDNLSLILVIPTLIGGFWQLIELSSISTAYIRFFSVTQVIPDGLLILFIILLIVSSYYFGGFILKWSPFYKSKITSWKISIIISLLILFVFGMSGYEFYKSISQTGNIRISDIVFIIFSITFYFGVLLQLIPHRSEIKIIENQKNKETENESNNSVKKDAGWIEFLKTFLALGIMVFIFFILKFTIIIISDLRTSYINTENLLNIRNLKKEILNNDDDKVFDKILYFNDKYFFIKLKDVDNVEYIRVLKTETMFEPNCQLSKEQFHP